jgi:fructose transport system substrate-binding protein
MPFKPASSLAALLGAAGLLALGAAQAADPIVIGLITKTETNPFFVKMKEGATEEAKAKGAQLRSGAGKTDGDNAGQVTQMENMIAAGAKTILITPNDSKAIVPSIKKARDKGVLVIALDSPTDPADATDALFATDNYKAGVLIGQYAKAALAGKPAKIVTLDLFPGHPVGAASACRRRTPRATNSARPAKSCACPTASATRPRARRRWKTACKRRPT